MAVLDETGTILVDDAGLMWRKPRVRSNPRGLHGLDGFLGELGFNWEGFGQAAAGIGGAVAGIIVAKKTGQAPIQGGIAVSGSGMGSSGGFSMSPQTIMLLGGAALLLVVMMKK